jgi:hypothetical protein
LFVDYLNHGDAPSIVVRIDAFAHLVAPGLTQGAA